jgi:hypothetical protein
MTTANSNRHAQQLEQQENTHQDQLQRVISAIIKELKGLTYDEVNEMYDTILIDKYAINDFSAKDRAKITDQVLKLALGWSNENKESLAKVEDTSTKKEILEPTFQEGKVILETLLFRVNLILITESGYLLRITRKADNLSYYADWITKFSNDEHRNLIASMLADPKNIDKFENAISSSLKLLSSST